MASRAFQSSRVQMLPRQAGQPCTPMMENEDRCEVFIRGPWERGTDCILDVRFTDTDAPAYQMKDPIKVLEASECLKKKKILQPCLGQFRHFTPFIVSVDGLIGKELKTVFKSLAARTATKTGKMYSNDMGCIRACLSIAIFRATQVCLRGSRFPASRMSNIHQ
jgi:hypothetical protein